VGTVLVTGGTGLLGRRVAAELDTAGHTVRVLSRGPAAAESVPGRLIVGDLRTGEGLAEAVAGADAIVHCASAPRDFRAVDIEGTARLLAAAEQKIRGTHLVYISIVGIDRLSTGYYQAKLAVERSIEGSGIPWTMLRATQFHEFCANQFDRMTRLPVALMPRNWRIQPVDVGRVAARLADAATSEPAHRLPDLGGPEVLSWADAARGYLQAVDRHRPVLQIPVPGAFSAAMRQGANLAGAGERAGGQTWSDFLSTHVERSRSAEPPAQG
jgi:uncharacterized protein YbjT (DUF2867 family)